jgi:hypothetical protein
MQTIPELQVEILRLWPEYERVELELGPLCYKLVKVWKIQAQGKKGKGITAWCETVGIDRNRFNYLVRKFTPENEKARATPPKKQVEPDAEDLVEIQQSSSPGDFTNVFEIVQARVTALPLAEQLVQLDWLLGQLQSLRAGIHTKVSAGNAQKPLVTGISGISKQEVTTDGPPAA